MFKRVMHNYGVAIACRHPWRTLTVALLACGLFPPVSKGEDESLPKAEEILEKSIEATGGRAAYEKLHNRVSKGTFSIEAMGLKADMTTYAAAPRKHRVVIKSDMLGTLESGTNGEVVWDNNMMAGPQIKKGEERAAILRGATFNAELHWKDLYKSAETAGVEDVDGRPAYKVIQTPHEGNPETVWYDKETFRNVKMETTLETAMGTVSLVAQASDYKEVDGVLMPHKVVQVVGVQKMDMVTTSVEHNVEMPPDIFKLPAEIQALLDKQKEEPAAKPDKKDEETAD